MVGNCQPSTNSAFKAKEKTHFFRNGSRNNNSKRLLGISCVDVLGPEHKAECSNVQN